MSGRGKERERETIQLKRSICEGPSAWSFGIPGDPGGKQVDASGRKWTNRQLSRHVKTQGWIRLIQHENAGQLSHVTDLHAHCQLQCKCPLNRT